MKLILTATAFGTASALSTAFSGAGAKPQRDLLDLQRQYSQEERFNAWKLAFNKNFATVEENAEALAAFTSNDLLIEQTNAQYNSGEISYYLGHNEFSGMSWERFSQFYLGHRGERMQTNNPVHQLRGNSPDEIDWVARGAVTSVKNQQTCGSCWAFSAVGAIEGDIFIETGSLVDISEEELVECDTVDNGCQGGLMDNAFNWVIKNRGLCSEDDYPYTSGGGSVSSCSKKSCNSVATITSFTDVTAEDEDALKDAVAQQPVSVAIEADRSTFQLYAGGVLDSSQCGTNLDHGVLIVGYGTDSSNGKDYWKVKNSWGSTWGMDGFVQIVRDKNMCGIATQPSYPTGGELP